MTDFNPGRLQNVSRSTDEQYITPGGTFYDYGRPWKTNSVPAVGNYPSGSPYGLSDGEAAPVHKSPVVWIASIAAIGALVWLAWTGDRVGAR